MTVRLYVDDSGGKRQPTPAVFAGLLHTDNEWASFSEAWRSALDREPRVWRHKMDDAAGLDGAYRGMTSEDRDRKLRALATVLKLHSPTVFVASVDVDRLAAFVEPLVMPPQDDPYFQLSVAVVFRVAVQLVLAHHTEPFGVTFDESKIQSPRVLDFWPVLLDNASRLAERWPGTVWPALRQLLPEDPEFMSDDHVMPLQAADTYAWLFRAEGLGRDHGLRWLRDVLPPAYASIRLDSVYFDRLLGTPVPDDVRRMVDPERYARLLGLDGPMNAMPGWKRRRTKAWRRTKIIVANPDSRG